MFRYLGEEWNRQLALFPSHLSGKVLGLLVVGSQPIHFDIEISVGSAQLTGAASKDESAAITNRSAHKR
jgi:hypothetical protein